MLEQIILFFKTPPPAMDPLFVPWVAALIGGNIIIFTAFWALFKYIAKLTPWAEDDKIIQIVTGAYTAIKDAVGSVKKNPPVEAESNACPICGHEMEETSEEELP